MQYPVVMLFCGMRFYFYLTAASLDYVASEVVMGSIETKSVSWYRTMQYYYDLKTWGEIPKVAFSQMFY